jgi:apolipoprotein N-acyltransferase
MEGQAMRTKRLVKPLEQRPPAVGAWPSPAVPRTARLPFPCLLPALATGLLLWLCFFPVGWGWLGWVALVPLLCLVRSRQSGRRVFACAYVAGLAFFVPALQWMRVADLWMYAAWAALAIYIALYFPVAVWLLRRLDRATGWPLAVTLPLVWTGLEFVRAYLLSGFPWYYLAHTQHRFLALIQVSDLGGAYAVSALVAAGNGLAFELLYARRGFRTFFALPADVPPARRWALPVQAAAVLLLVVTTLAYGAWRLGESEFAAGPRLALLQGNIPQRVRNAAISPEEEGARARRQIIVHYNDLCLRATGQRPRPDLIVWPETSFPADWHDISPAVPADRVPADLKSYQKGVARDIVARYKTNVLLGMSTQLWSAAGGREQRYNSALLIHKEGRVGGRYDKIHRVPFGEFVPFRKEIPWMNVFNPYGYDFSIEPGESWSRLPLDGYRFGVLICYEDTDPALAREYARADKDGRPVDFLVNISNDGWFDGTAEHDEHLAICRFRAVECRRAVARAVNMGISAVIDGNGRVLRPQTVAVRDGVPHWEVKDSRGGDELPVSEWHRYKKSQGVLTAVIPIDGRASLYARWGDWLPWSCWAGVGAALLWGRFRRPAARAKEECEARA